VKSVKEMMGDFFRELAPLIFVFAFLDKLIFHEPIDFWWTVNTVFAAGVMLVFGVALERSRKKA
jgi:hypothetical protein